MVRLELYSISGIRVAILAEQQLSAGGYTIQLNASALDPGMYIYTLTTEYGVKSLKMTVVN